MKKIIILSFLMLLLISCGKKAGNKEQRTDSQAAVTVESDNLTSFCQFDLFFPLQEEFDWAKIEKQNHELKIEFIKNNPKEFEYYRLDYENSLTLSDLEHDLHIIDFNGDGLDDIIFDGESGSEAREISIFINIGRSFSKIFTEYQEIYKMVIENGRVHKLYIRDEGCCCEYIGISKIYCVDYSRTFPEINLISKMEYLNHGYEGDREYPSHYFDKPVKFEVLNNQYNIRFSPVMDDTTQIHYCGEPRNGNSLGKIKSGSIGYALAEKVDATGRVWWFVALEPQSKIYESIYNETIDTYKLGWISNKFVKEIKE